MASLSKQIVSGALWMAGATWIGQVAGFTVFLVLARLLGPEAFGLAKLAMFPQVLLLFLVMNGIPDALIRHPKVEPEQYDCAFWLLTATGGMLGALILIFAGAIAAAFGQPPLEDLIRGTSIVVVLQSIAGVPTAILQRQLKFRVFALRNLAGTTTGGLLGIAMALEGFGAWSLVAMQIAGTAVGATLTFLACSWRPRLYYSHKHSKDLFNFAGPAIGQAFAALAKDELPTVPLGLFLGPQAVGIYAFARKPFGILWDIVLHPLLALAMPTVSRLQDEPAKIDRFVDTAVRLAALIGLPVFAGFAAVAPVLVPLVFGAQWLSAVPAIQIITPLAVPRVIEYLCGATMFALGYGGLILKLNVAFIALSSIPIVFAAQFSVEVMVVAIVACNLAVLPVVLVATQRIARVDVQRPLAIVPRLAIATSLMFACVTMVQLWTTHVTPPVLTLFFEIVIGIIVYGTATIILVRSDLLTARDILSKLRQ